MVVCYRLKGSLVCTARPVHFVAESLYC